MLDLAANEPLPTGEQRRWHRESRAAWLRLVVLAVLVVNLGLSERQIGVAVYAGVVGGCAIATIAALALGWLALLGVAVEAHIDRGAARPTTPAVRSNVPSTSSARFSNGSPGGSRAGGLRRMPASDSISESRSGACCIAAPMTSSPWSAMP